MFTIRQVTIFMLKRPVQLRKATRLGYSVINFQQPLAGAYRFGTTCTDHQLEPLMFTLWTKTTSQPLFGPNLATKETSGTKLN